MLKPEQITKIAYNGLAKIVEDKPAILKDLLSTDSIDSMVNKLTDDPSSKKALLEKLTPKEQPAELDYDDLVKELQSTGGFSTDRLPENAKVNFVMAFSNFYDLRIDGRVVKDSDEENWIKVIKTEGRTLGFCNIPQYELIRLGHIESGEQKTNVMFGAAGNFIFKNYDARRDTRLLDNHWKLLDFSLNDEELPLNYDLVE